MIERFRAQDFGDGNILQYFEALFNSIVIQTNNTNNCVKNYAIYFPNNNEYNANICHEGIFDVVGINIGLIMQIYHHSYICFMNKLLFPELGIGDNIEGMNIWSFQGPKLNTLGNGYKQIDFYSGSENKKRLKVARAVAVFGIQFILFHELGHLLGGHLDYISNTFNLSELYAQGSEDILYKKTNDYVLYQTIEMDADLISLHLLLENIKCSREYYKDFFGFDDVDIGKMIVVAITIALFLMDSSHINIEMKQLSNSNYLPRDYRFHLIVSKLLSKLKSDYKELTGYNSTELISQYLLTNDFVKEIYGTEKNNISEIPSNEMDQYYYNVILKKWELIRDDIQKYASITLPK